MNRRNTLTLTVAALMSLGPAGLTWAKPGPSPNQRPFGGRPGGPEGPGRIFTAPGHHIPHVPRGAISIGFSGGTFYFHAGIFYRWLQDGYVVVAPPIGIIVPVLPSGCEVRYLSGDTYYVLHDTYYRRIPGGYVVVTEPSTIIVTTPAPAPAPKPATCTIWIRNVNGSKTPVVLEPGEGGQWIGPKGEYYDTFPSEDQLRPVYGLNVAPPVEAQAVSESGTRTLWITNTNGSRTPVELDHNADGTWTGPNGEVYDEFPNEEQLQETYGLKPEK